MRCVFVVCLFLLAGCGVNTSIPSDASSDSSRDPNIVEKAVFISHVSTNSSGTMVQCDLNSVLEGSGDIPVFIEFEGTEMERKTFKSIDAQISFARFNPSQDGNVVCVIEFAGAEFESDPLWIESQ